MHMLMIGNFSDLVGVFEKKTGADPGIPVGGANHVWGAPTSDVGAFWRKCM